MKRTKVVLNFLQFPLAIRVILYRSVIAHLLGNPYFVTTSVDLDVASAALDALETSITNALDGSHLNIALRRDAAKAADEIFRNLASYVDTIAMGNETIILSSGFAASRQPITSQKAVLTATNGSHSGSVKLTTIKGYRTYSYIWRIRKVSINGVDFEWVVITTTTQTTYEVTGLDVACEYLFQVAGVTPEGITEFCQSVTKLVV